MPLKALVSALLLMFVTAVPAQQLSSRYRLSAEDDVLPHAVALPSAVLEKLSQEELVRGRLQNKTDGDIDSGVVKPSLASCFSAVKLRPVSATEDLYIVMAIGPLRGANVTEFWAIRHDRKASAAEVLWDSPQHDVGLRYRAHVPYPDLRVSKMSAVHIWKATFRYRNGKYVLIHQDDE